jgi:hypothetical protein
MLPERVSVKFFVDGADAVDLPSLVPVFHRWIREGSVPGLLIDVADYVHVVDGPAVQLVGHDGDYVLDGGANSRWPNGRFGLLYKQKREWQGDNLQDRLRSVLQRATQATQLLHDDPGLTFRADEVEISFPDRLNVPNTAKSFAAVQEEVTAVLREFANTDEVVLAHVNTEARRPFTLHATLLK